MLTSPTDLPLKNILSRLGIFVAGLALLVAGCDVVSQQQETEKNDEITWEVTNNLAERITHVDGNSSANSVTASSKKSAPSFELRSHVDPPAISGEPTVRASEMALSETPGVAANRRNLYIGYKVFGSGYGGGIDILDAPSGSPSNDDLGPATSGPGSATALEVDNVDVQSVAVRHDANDNPRALYVATAVEPDGGFSEAPQFHSIGLFTDDGLPNDPVGNESEELFSSNNTARIAKSVTSAPDNGTYNAFVVSDVNTVHGVKTTNRWQIDNVDKAEASSGTLFRSVTTSASGSGRAFALSDGGHIYEFSSAGGGGLSQRTSSALGTISSDFSIARITAATINGEDLLFVALNEGGFRVFNIGLNDVVFSDPDIFATSVAATSDNVYVANGDGFALYDVEGSGLGNTNPDTGLNDVGRASISDFDGIGGSIPAPTDAQVNHILVDDSGSNPIVYVAKSTDGVYKIEQTSGGVWN